ncbi:MAG TPA: ROK family protein [Terracidiphilus sp.]
MAGFDNHVLVYDVGGSHISAAVFDGGTCSLAGEASAGYPSEQTTETFLHVLHSLGAAAMQAGAGVRGAALAMPGPFDYNLGVSWMQHKLPYLYGFDLRGALAGHFGWPVSKVHFLNDAAAFLTGEVAAGAARGVDRVVGITLGTGVGSAFAVNGHVVREGSGVPTGGEIWNVPYQGGIVEDQISTRAIQKSYRERTGQERDVAAIAGLAAADPIAAELFAEFGRNLGVALRQVLSVFAPQVIVLGGGISRSAHLFVPAAQSEVGGFAELRVSALRDHAPLVGAGAAWFESEGREVPEKVPATS